MVRELITILVCIFCITNLNYTNSAYASSVTDKMTELWKKSHDGQLHIFLSTTQGKHNLLTLERFVESPNGTYVGDGFTFDLYIETANSQRNFFSQVLYGVCDLNGYCGTGDSSTERPMIISKFNENFMEVILNQMPLEEIFVPEEDKNSIKTCYRLFAWNGPKDKFPKTCNEYPPAFVDK